MVIKLNSLKYSGNLTVSEDILFHQNDQRDEIFVRRNILDDALEKHKKEDLLKEENQSISPTVSATNITRRNWEMSYNKWWWLVILAKLHIRFHTKKGFSFLKVLGKCGYCIEFESNCFNCNLYKQNLCCSIKNLTKEKRRNTVLWKYLRAMQKGVKNYNAKINWKKDVLAYAIEMRDAIKKDQPKGKTRINSIFTPLQIFSPKAV